VLLLVVDPRLVLVEHLLTLGGPGLLGWALALAHRGRALWRALAGLALELLRLALELLRLALELLWWWRLALELLGWRGLALELLGLALELLWWRLALELLAARRRLALELLAARRRLALARLELLGLALELLGLTLWGLALELLRWRRLSLELLLALLVLLGVHPRGVPLLAQGWGQAEQQQLGGHPGAAPLS